MRISRTPKLTKLWSGKYYVSDLEIKYFKMGPDDLIKAKKVNMVFGKRWSHRITLQIFTSLIISRCLVSVRMFSHRKSIIG